MSGCSGPRTFCRDPERFLKERFGFGVLAHGAGTARPRSLRLAAVSGCSGPRTFWLDPERFLKERLGFGVLAHYLVQQGQVIQARGGVRLLWAVNPLC